MQPVDTPLDVLTFVFAWIAYLSVTVAMLARYAGSERTSRWAAPTMAGVATFHVLLVWGVRHDFDPGHLAVTGAALVPLILLYTLFTLVLIHGLGHARSKLAGRAIYPAFVLVTLMGMPGPFLMPDLSFLRIPMAATFAAAIIGLVLIRRRRASHPDASLGAVAAAT